MSVTDRSRRILNLPEVAHLTRTPEATLRYWRHRGTGPRSFKIGRRVMYDERDVLAWLDAHRAGVKSA
jgi:predicted DNA-binding transcriptional regulator AlpA